MIGRRPAQPDYVVSPVPGPRPHVPKGTKTRRAKSKHCVHQHCVHKHCANQHAGPHRSAPPAPDQFAQYEPDDLNPRTRILGPIILGLVSLMVLIGGLGTWSVTTFITTAIIAPAQVEIANRHRVVQHADGGEISAVMVGDGDSVTRGAPLLQLTTTNLQDDRIMALTQLYELAARRARLEAERDGAARIDFPPDLIRAATGSSDTTDTTDTAAIQRLMDGQTRLFNARTLSMTQEIAQLYQRQHQIDAQILGMNAQSDALGVQMHLIAQERADQQRLLDRGLTPTARVNSLAREEARLNGMIGELAAQIAQSQGRRTEIGLNILRLKSQHRQEAITRLRDLQFRETELAEQLRALDRRIDHQTVRAPVAGIIHALGPFGRGSVLRPAEPILSILPRDEPLILVAQIPARDIDHAYVGQPVTIRLPTLDQRTTPKLSGEITKISADALHEPDTHAPYYRTEIAIHQDIRNNLPSPLIAGLQAEIYVTTGRRRPLDYLTQPFGDYLAHALTSP